MTLKQTIQIVAAVLILVLIGSLAFLKTENAKLKEDNTRLQLNTDAAISNAGDIGAAQGEPADIMIMTLERDEAKRLLANAQGELKKMGIRIKDLQQVGTEVSKMEVRIETKWRDSIKVLPGRIDTLKCAEYKDPWVTFSGCADSAGNFRANIESIDTLKQAVSVEKKKFLFFRYGIKGIKQTIHSTNPHNRIVYQDYFFIK